MRRLTRLTLTAHQYRQVAELALVFLTLIVFTGAAVRLSGSGLGCPDWPKCYGKIAPPLETHAFIEFGNRMLSGLVGVVAAAAGLLAFRRRPFRKDLAIIGVLLPLGVIGQAVLGGFTVRNHLAPGFVMGHYVLSMLILIAAAALAWRARWEPGERPPSTDRLSVWSVRALLPLGAFVILVGTAATAAGPHAGGAGTGDEIDRLDWKGANTLDWAIHQHGRIASVLGVAAVAVWFLLRRRGADPEVRRAMTVACLLLAAQGAVGAIQYQLELPAEIVWVHVVLAACLWLALLWATAAAGRLAPVPEAAAATRARPPLVRS
jgi:cytochrome c oxidase assembly protein subunit 15